MRNIVSLCSFEQYDREQERERDQQSNAHAQLPLLNGSSADDVDLLIGQGEP